MKKVLSPIFAIILLSACSKNTTSSTPAPTPTPTPVPVTYQFNTTPDWQEDFTGSYINSAWKIYSPGARQDGFSDTTGISFDGNNFVNKVYSDTVAGVAVHHAGMIRTAQEFQYGKFEARIAFSNSTGSWSAFWMQSTAMGITTPVDPKTNGMEIDIVETLPNDNRSFENLHWGGYAAYHQSASNTTSDYGVNSGNYHVYTLEWTPTYYKYYIDGVLTWNYTANVSNHTEFIILSSEVKNYAAGSWCGPFPLNGFGTKAKSNTIMKVDYVKWYKMQ